MTRPGAGSDLAKKAAMDEADVVVAVGGDGTVNEVANGILSSERSLRLAVVPAGSGSDFARTFSLGTNPETVTALIDNGQTRPIDAVSVNGRWFVNAGEVGLGAAVVKRAAAWPKWLGPTVYGLALAVELPRFKATPCRVTVDGVTVETSLHNVVIANCRYLGGGMHISPKSLPGDGLLEVLIFAGPKTDAITLVPKIYRGRHLPHADVVEMQGARVTVQADWPLPVEGDGEPMGATPAEFVVSPGALRLIC